MSKKRKNKNKKKHRKNSNYKRVKDKANKKIVELFEKETLSSNEVVGSGADFTSKLFSEEKYIQRLEQEYVNLQKNERARTRLLELDKDLERFIGNGDFGKMLPDNINYYSYASEKYLQKDAELTKKSNYLALIGDSDYLNQVEVPDSFLLAALCGHIVSELKKINVKERTISEEKMQKLEVLFAKEKLIYGLFSHFDRLAGIYTNYIDAMEEKFLDENIKELDSFSIKQRFIAAIQSNQKIMAFKLLGRMKDLDPGEDYYFEALAHYFAALTEKDISQYGDTIRYINKIDRDNIDYVSATLLKLECLSSLGKIDEFINCLENNRDLNIDFWQLQWLTMNLLLNIPESMLKYEHNNDLNIDINLVNAVKKLIQNCEAENSDDIYYRTQSFRLVGKMVVEQFLILEQIMEIPEQIFQSAAVKRRIDKDIIRFNRLSLALMLFQPSEEFYRLADLELIVNQEQFNRQKGKAAVFITQMLIDKNPKAAFSDFKASLEAMVKLGQYDSFIHNVNTYSVQIINLAEKGNFDANELLRHAYIESVLSDNIVINEGILKYIESQSESDIETDIDDKKIIRFLSPQGKLAYDAAEWQFKRSQEEDYGWRDAGLISLGYFRILELEMNLKLVIPLLKAAGSSEVIKEINSTNNADVPDGNGKKYKNLWTKNVNKYSNLEDSGFTGDRYMLGEMRYFF